MPELIRHTKIDGSRLLNGYEGITGAWGVTTVAGTSTYNMFDANGSPYTQIAVIRAFLIITSAPGAGDTVVVNHVSAAGAANAITDTANLALFALNNQVDFSDIIYTYSIVNKGQNLQVVTASGAIANVIVEYVVVE